MTSRRARATVRMLVASAVVLMAPEARADAPTLLIPRTPPPDMEALRSGRLEMPERITEFRQRDPGDGVPVSRTTTAVISYDENNLWVVFVCADEPREIRAHLTRREATWTTTR